MKNSTKIISLVLSLVMVLGLFNIVPFSIQAAEIDTITNGSTPDEITSSGITGECVWSVEGTVLTISGNGRMHDYKQSFSDVTPWQNMGITEVIVEEGVTHIGDYSFGVSFFPDAVYYKNLELITIPDSVTSIGNYAFGYCSGLTDITLPDSLTYIGDYAFMGCTSLSTIAFPDSVTSIGEGAFYNCYKLTSIGIPKSVSIIGDDAFAVCWGLESITVEEGNPVYDSRNNCNAIIESASDTLIAGCKNTVIPDTVTGIGQDAFRGCRGLRSIAIPSSVTGIGYRAFGSCDELISVSIPDSVVSIGSYAFSFCTKLIDISIPDSVANIGTGVFRNTAWFEAQPDGVIYLGTTAYSVKGECPAEVEIIAGTTSIAGDAFSNQPNLTTISFPDSLTSIGEGAFSRCKNLKEMVIPDSVTDIGYNAFWDTAWYNDQPDGIVYVGKVAYGVKGECPAEVIINDGSLAIADNAFLNCSDMTNLIIPDSVVNIGDLAFQGCSNLTNVSIPASVTTIGNSAFHECANLTSVTILDSVTSIGSHAFGYYGDWVGTTYQYSKVDGFTIYGCSDTAAEEYANENDITFIEIGNPDEDQIESIEFLPASPIVLYENQDGNYYCGIIRLDEDEFGYYYYDYSDDEPKKIYKEPTDFRYNQIPVYKDGNKLIVHYKDDSTKTLTQRFIFTKEDHGYFFVDENGNYDYSVRFSWGDQQTTPFKLGDVNQITIRYLDNTTTVPVTVVPNNIERIEYQPVKPIVFNIDDPTDVGRGFIPDDPSYLSYNPQRIKETGSKLIAHFKDGSTKRFTFYSTSLIYDGHYIPGTDSQYWAVDEEGSVIGYSSLKFDYNTSDWTPGNTYYMTVGYLGATTQVPITVTSGDIQGNILGDVDGDNNIEIRDATWIQRHVAEVEMPFVINKTTADVDGDGIITVMDATAIQYYLANMKTTYKIGEKLQ